MKNKKLLMVVLIISLLIAAAIILTIRNTKREVITIDTPWQQVSAEKMLFPTLSPDGKDVIYFNNAKEPAFYQMGIENKEVKKLSGGMGTPDEIIWSPNKTRVILKVAYDQYIFEKYGSKFASPGTPDQTITTWRYELQSQSLTKLDDRIQNVAWTKENEIVYQYLDEEKNISYIATANPDGTGESKIVDLPTVLQYGISFAPGGNTAAIYSIPTDISPSTIYSLSLEDKKLNQIREIEGNTKVIAADNKFFFNLPAKRLPQLAVMNEVGTKMKPLGINTILDSIAVLNENKVIIPAQGTSENDTFYQINLSDYQVSKMVSPSKEKIKALNLMISPDNKTLYFTSDDYLYKLRLE